MNMGSHLYILQTCLHGRKQVVTHNKKTYNVSFWGDAKKRTFQASLEIL